MSSLKSKIRLVKGLCVGYPGTAKTGSLAALINSGRYNVRILDFDGNYDPLYEYVKPENYDRVEIKTFEDKMRMGVDKIVPIGTPRAFELAMKLLLNWKYTDKETGEEIDLGPIDTWGPDDVLVLDSLTAMGTAAMLRVLSQTNRLAKGPTRRTWLLAMTDQENCIKILTNDSIKCNVLVIAHLKMIGPKQEDEKDSDDVKDAKKEMHSLIPFRLYPSALGQELPPKIASNFPYVLLYESRIRGRSVKRLIHTAARENVDIKVPLKEIEKELPVESGLLTLFEKVQGKRKNA